MVGTLWIPLSSIRQSNEVWHRWHARIRQPAALRTPWRPICAESGQLAFSTIHLSYKKMYTKYTHKNALIN